MLFCNRFNSVSVFLLLLFKQFCLARFRFVSEFWLLCFQATTQHTKTLPATMEIPIRSQNEREYNLSFIGYPSLETPEMFFAPKTQTKTGRIKTWNTNVKEGSNLEHSPSIFFLFSFFSTFQKETFLLLTSARRVLLLGSLAEDLLRTKLHTTKCKWWKGKIKTGSYDVLHSKHLSVGRGRYSCSLQRRTTTQCTFLLL